MTTVSNELKAKIINSERDFSVVGVSVELVKIEDGYATVRFNLTNENGHPMLHIGEAHLSTGDEATVLRMDKALKIKLEW